MSTKAKSNGAESDDYTMEHRTTMPYLSAAYQDRVRPCIDLVDSLRRIGLDKDVDLPAVVVIGDQSVGKSSVLEAISGVQLPRGTEIVTRCPVELRLKTLDENDWRGRIRYASYSKESVDKYIDHPDNVGAEIREAQNKITNSQRGISDSLITVEIESPYVPNLTLIDLPGIARVALDGQPDNIADKIKTLLKKFIAKEETIILCVIPCNVDIATTEALKMAQEVDPSGSRTLGVLTKPDLVDLGTEPNVVKIAQNKVIPLKKGYTVIKCRGQKNVESKQPLDEAMDEEDRFFKEHRIYNVLYHERCAGTRVLANKLTSELVEQIRKSVPQLQRGIKDKLEETKQELVALGDTVPIDTVERVDLLVRILGRFPEDFQNAADGVYKNATWDRSLRLQSIVKRLYEKFADELEALQPSDNYLPEIKEEIREQRGLELPPFVKDRIICENLIRKIIKEFIPPAERLLQAVNFEVERIGQKLVMDTYQQFPRLQTTVMSKFCDLQQQAVHFTKEAIDIKFKMEDMIQTQDRVYRDVEKMMLQSPPSGASSSSSDPPGGGSSSGNTVDGGDDERPYTYDEESESRKVLRALQVYLKVATNRLMDDIPMTITYYLLQELAKEIKTEMAKLMIEKNFDDFLREDPAIEERRLALENKRERLDRANKELALFTL
ncbi:interferon-induced GTP-binding protein Mx3-like isoform X4 [Ptychodera flava]|uniref:interferon-induced GTP-binding protein Mx3-like isoform X4 n=1 Tax=Ptychodera flava TaxID=63121 RepID=UPI00396AA4BF